MPASGPYGFTHLRDDGNRVLEGVGGLPAEPATVELDVEPAWLVGLPDGDASVWAVVGTDGTTRGLRLADGTVESTGVRTHAIPVGVPPVAALGSDGPRLLAPPTDEASTLTHPFPLDDGRALVVGADGAVRLVEDGTVDRLAVDALPDARLLRAAPGTFAVLGGATERYGHGALADEVEAGALVVFDVDDGLAERARATFDDVVVEGLSPMAVAFDGEPLLVVTLTDDAEGARVVAFDLEGNRAATGPAIGTGFRWRHQLCAAPFGPDGATELAVVKTPHIGGVAEFYRRRGDRLELVAERSGYSTHAFDSRNLDGALAADLDGDGAVELLAPTQSRDVLAAVRRTTDGTAEPWRLPLEGDLSTNVAGLTTAGGRAVVAAGTADGTLRFWS